MGKITSVIIIALIGGVYLALSTGGIIAQIIVFGGFVIFWLVVKPVKKEKEEKKVTEEDLQDLKEELEEKIKKD
jgi:uncharacterized membrane protein YqhA